MAVRRKASIGCLWRCRCCDKRHGPRPYCSLVSCLWPGAGGCDFERRYAVAGLRELEPDHGIILEREEVSTQWDQKPARPLAKLVVELPCFEPHFSLAEAARVSSERKRWIAGL